MAVDEQREAIGKIYDAIGVLNHEHRHEVYEYIVKTFLIWLGNHKTLKSVSVPEQCQPDA